jgi:hypothetical protein
VQLGADTVRRMVEACELEDRRGLWARGTLNLRQLLSEKGGAKGAARWCIGTGRLRQFDLAGRLLYGELGARGSTRGS